MATGPRLLSNARSTKRKRPEQQHSSSHKRQRVSLQDARAIAAQTSGRAFGDGQLDVDKFVGAREFEIKALEDGMRRSKKLSSMRAFQNVPRDLRRRTASHNVKRVPKRLRARAAKEMADDNTPTVTARKRKPTPHMRLRLDTAKNAKTQKTRKRLEAEGAERSQAKDGAGPQTASAVGNAITRKKTGIVRAREPHVKKNVLAKAPKPKAKFRKRQIHKAWLPTHLFHAKRAHMTPPKEPLWRMAIPLSPTAKSYRPIHRASSGRGAVAWDMSYMSTIGLEGPQKSVQGLLKGLGIGNDEIDGFSEKKKARWLNGSRFWEGWLYERDGWPTKSIAPAIVVWCRRNDQIYSNEAAVDGQTKKEKAPKSKVIVRVHPSAFLQLWEEVLRLSKVQKPAVMVEDLRFEIGSIDLVGPASTEALVGVLRPSTAKPDTRKAVDDHEYVWDLLGDLANPASLPASVVLGMDVVDPRLRQPRQTTDVLSEGNEHRLLQTLATWPLDKFQTPAKIFDRTARLNACRQLPSQKAINRRKTLVEPGHHPKPVPNDPIIPVMLLPCRNQGGGQGSWTLLLPWKCVLPVWYALMYFPLSTGGTIRFGGLEQKRQIAFETNTPWFPADYPGTKAGMAWEVKEREKRKKEWEKRPKGKRVEFNSLNLGQEQKGEVGLGWSCDWEKVVGKNQREEGDPPTQTFRVPAAMVERIIKKRDLEDSLGEAPGGLVTVKLTLLSRGVPKVCARIYRLPIHDVELRGKWLTLLPSPKGHDMRRAPPVRLTRKDASPHIVRRYLATGLLEPQTIPQAGGSAYPDVPGEGDLVGFVTTGNFNLGEGRGTGLGCILLSKILESRRSSSDVDSKESGAEVRLCIVREAGQAMGRLARWDVE